MSDIVQMSWFSWLVEAGWDVKKLEKQQDSNYHSLKHNYYYYYIAT